MWDARARNDGLDCYHLVVGPSGNCQADYGAAKAGMVGLMNVLAEEGRKNNIRVNTISPTAATRMTEELLPPQALGLLQPEAITPAVEFLLSEDAPTRTIMGAGAGSFAVIKVDGNRGHQPRAIRLDPRRGTRRILPDLRYRAKARALQVHRADRGDARQAAGRAGIKFAPSECGYRGVNALSRQLGASLAIHDHASFDDSRATEHLVERYRTEAKFGMPAVMVDRRIEAYIGGMTSTRSKARVIVIGTAGLMAAEVLAQGDAERHCL